MPAFFAISGYFARRAVNSSYKELLGSKFGRLFVPAIIWTVINFVLLFFVLMTESSLTDVVVRSVRSNWYLYTLFMFFVLAGLIWKSRYKYWIAVGLALLLWFTDCWQTPYFFSYFHITREWPCFLSGLLFAECVAKPMTERKGRMLKAVIAVSAVVYTALVSSKFILGNQPFLLRCIMMLAGGIFVNWMLHAAYKPCEKLLPHLSKVVVAIGNASLGIYLMNEVIFRIVDYYIPNIATGSYLLLFVFALLTVAVCYGMTILIRKSVTIKKYLLGE